jgi:hypothetical protein
MSWTWVGSFRIREYLENPAQAWPPEFNAVYVVSEDAWTAGNGPNAAFYVGTSYTRRFRARIGDLVADMLGLGSSDFAAHHSGGFQIWKHWYAECRRNPLDLFLGWWVQNEGGDCVVCAEIFLWESLGQPRLNGGRPHHKKNNYFSCLCMQRPSIDQGRCCCSFRSLDGQWRLRSG